MTNRSNIGSAGWLAVSLVVHLVLATVATHVFRSMEQRRALLRQDVLPVEVVQTSAPDQDQQSARAEVVPEPWQLPPPVEPAARVGDAQQRADRDAADTLQDSTTRGSVAGQGRARPHPDPLAGDDLDDLRFRPLNHRTRDTVSRIRTSKRAVSYDNERATPNPSASPRLVTGPGKSMLRSPATARSGRQRASRSRARQASGSQWQNDHGELSPGEAAWRRRLSRKVLGGHGPRAHRRPDMLRSTPRVLTRNKAMAVADQRNLEQASSKRHPNLAEMARPRHTGDNTGKGRGGRAGRRGDPGGDPLGAAIWLHTLDRRYMRYFRRIHRKIQPLWVFPKQLEIQLLQGDVQVKFTILSDGRVSNVKVHKSSGFPGFDRRVVAAVHRASPFGPIPKGLGRRLRVLAPFEFANPMVR